MVTIGSLSWVVKVEQAGQAKRQVQDIENAMQGVAESAGVGDDAIAELEDALSEAGTTMDAFASSAGNVEQVEDAMNQLAQSGSVNKEEFMELKEALQGAGYELDNIGEDFDEGAAKAGFMTSAVGQLAGKLKDIGGFDLGGIIQKATGGGAGGLAGIGGSILSALGITALGAKLKDKIMNGLGKVKSATKSKLGWLAERLGIKGLHTKLFKRLRAGAGRFFRKYLPTLGKTALKKLGLVGVGAALATKLIGGWDQFKKGIGSKGGGVLNKLGIGGLKGKFGGALKKGWNSFKGVLGKAGKGVLGKLGLAGIGKKLGSGLTQGWGRFSAKLAGSKAGRVLSWIMKRGGGYGIGEFAFSAMDAIKPAMEGDWGGAGMELGEAGARGAGALGGAYAGGKAGAVAGGAIGSVVPGAGTAAGAAIGGGLGALAGGVAGAGIGQGAWNTVTGAFSGPDQKPERFRNNYKVTSAPRTNQYENVPGPGGNQNNNGGWKWTGFAEGGIVTEPTPAMIGEAGENEAVIPLSRLNQMLDGGENERPVNIENIQVDIGDQTLNLDNMTRREIQELAKEIGDQLGNEVQAQI